MKTRKKKYGGELVQKQLDDCVKEKQVLKVKLEKETKEKKDLYTMIQELNKRNAESDKRNADLDKRLTITEEEAKITKEKLTKVSQNFLENRVITSLFEVMKHEKHGKGNHGYQNIAQLKLKDARNNIAHYFLDNTKQDIPRYQMYKKYLYEKIKKLQYEKSPIVEYINKRLIDVSYNKLDPIFDLNAFMSILATETASVSITPEVMTELDKWWQHGLI